MNTTIHLLKRIIKDGGSYIPIFLFLGVIGLVLIPIEFYGLLLSRKLIDKGFLLQNWDTTKSILFILIILFLFRSIIHYGTATYSTKIQLRINQKFQNILFSHFLHLPVRFFTREPTGRLMSRLLDDANRFSSILNMLFGPALLDPLKLIALLIFLMYMNSRLCVLMLISTVFSLLLIEWVGKRLRMISKRLQRKNAMIFSYVEEIFSNIELVKSKVTERQTAHDFGRLVNELIHLSLEALKITLFSQPILQALKYITLGAVFFYGSWMISRHIFTIGTLTIFLGGTYLFFNSLSSLGNNYGSLRESLARMEVLYEILDSPPEASFTGSGIQGLTTIQTIEFKDVSFAYNASVPVLKGVSFLINRGEVLGITGQSGSGKTTIVRLLLRFYEPDSGAIRFDDRSLDECALHSLRASISVAFQDNLILSSTIRDNIIYGNKVLDMKRILKAAKIAHAHDFIKILPNQYETIIGEKGKTLSGGERQRLAIARAIVTDPEILILDEGTSFLEIEQEAVILKKIKEVRRNKFTIIISHRLSAIKTADRVLILDNGRVLDTRIPEAVPSLRL